MARHCRRTGRRDRQDTAALDAPVVEIGFTRAEQDDFHKALELFFARLERIAERASDLPASIFLDPNCRWNGLINAISTYISGAEWDRISAKDFDRYDDTGVNWRVVEGLGSVVSAYGAGVPVMLDCPVHRIDHRDKRLRIETAKGVVTADQAIVTIPPTLLATEQVSFTPALPEKTEAAAGLPLGHDDKLFMSLDGAEEFDSDVRLFGHTDRAATGAYHFRPFGRPLIEAYFGGTLAAELEADGDAAFFDFAVSELTGFARQRDSPAACGRSASIAGASIVIRLALTRLLCRECGLSGDARRTGRRSAVLRRRSLFTQRLFDRPWRVADRRHCRRASDRRARAHACTLRRRFCATATLRIEDAARRCGICCERRSGTHRTGSKISTAVGTNASEPAVDAVAAKGTFERADHGVRCRWRQILVATLAAGAQFKHGHLRRIEARGAVKSYKRGVRQNNGGHPSDDCNSVNWRFDSGVGARRRFDLLRQVSNPCEGRKNKIPQRWAIRRSRDGSRVGPLANQQSLL